MSAESTEHTFSTEVIDDETVDPSQDEVQDVSQEYYNTLIYEKTKNI